MASPSEIAPVIEGQSSMDSSSEEVLNKVVKDRDFGFLRSAVALEPSKCLNRLCCSETNIFHIAALYNKVEFMSEAIKIVPASVGRSLLLQKRADTKENPLHVAARKCYYKMVKLILDYCRESTDEFTTDDHKPWLRRDGNQRTPLISALENRHQRVALEILSMDVQLLSTMEDKYHRSPLYIAVERMFNRVALQILTCAPNCSFSGSNGEIALFYAPLCSEEVFRLVVEKSTEHITWRQEKNGKTMLHHWVRKGKLHHFEHVLNGNVIAPRLRKDFINQLSIMDKEGGNPLIDINAINDEPMGVKMAKVLVNAYKQERAELFSSPDFQPPWLMKHSKNGHTPLHEAIRLKREKLALYFFSLDKIKFLDNHADLLRYAMDHCPKIAEKILDFIKEQQDERFMKYLTFDDGRNALHMAPKCTEGFLKKLLDAYPEFISETAEKGISILHSWIEIGEFWPFKYMMERKDVNPQLKSDFVTLVDYRDIKRRTPLHLAAESNLEEVMVHVVKLLLNSSDVIGCSRLLRSNKDNENNTPIDVAVSRRHEKLALLFLSVVNDLRDVDAGLLFKAIEHDCHQVVKFMLEWTTKSNNLRLLKSPDCNVLHLMWRSTVENAKLVVENWPQLIDDDDKDGKKPLQRAAEVGKPWIVELILQKDRSSVVNAPLAWVDACKNGHVSTILAFIDKSPYFRHICREHQETPLHHLEKVSYTELQLLFKNKFINECKNAKNKEGETPLHRAIRNENKDLVEVLLTTDGVDWSIRDKKNISARDFLKEKCKVDDAWATMCKMIGVYQTLNMEYIQVNTDVIKMRDTISLVAALLATITFTAGFTLPGGIDSNSGEAVLVKKTAFVVFLLADTYAMCCSMLILFCIIWSMICDSRKMAVLTNHSLDLLKHSLYGTLVAFMTAVYLVTHKKSLWIAIIVIVMCSLAIILAQRSILYKMFGILKYMSEKEYDLRMQLILSLKALGSSVRRGKKQPTSNDQSQEDVAPLTTITVKRD